MAVIVFGIITLIAGVILSSVPWLNYFILKVKFDDDLRYSFILTRFGFCFLLNRICGYGMERLVFTTGSDQA